MSRAVARKGEQTLTDQQRMSAVLGDLASRGIAYLLDLRGRTGVLEDRYNDYIRAAQLAGTDRWVGEHVGNYDLGGARWDRNGTLVHADGELVRDMRWSFNHELAPSLPELLVAVFVEHGFAASWSGYEGDCVEVLLGGDR